MQLILKKDQETSGGERYQLLAFGPDNIIAAVYHTTLHFLDAKQGFVLEEIEVHARRPCNPSPLLLVFMTYSPFLHDCIGSSADMSEDADNSR